MELWVAIIAMVGAGIGAGGITKIFLQIAKNRTDAYAKRYIKRLENRLDDLEKKLEESQQHQFDLTVQVIRLEGEANYCPMRNDECVRHVETSIKEM
jgi:hypothetical protein